jgi:hypothetical protein
MVTLLTPTGGRPEAFALLTKMVNRQDYLGRMRWIVVDDVKPPTFPPFPAAAADLVYVQPVPEWQPGQNTQCRNLLAGLEYYTVGSGPLLIVEDDDYYATNYVSTMVRWLEKAELVGEGQARYYNVAQRRYHQHNNLSHASLCSTAMQGKAVDIFRAILEKGAKYIDLDLWAACGLNKSVHPNIGLCVGIKGLPGRPGIGVGHEPSFGIADPAGGQLVQWIGKDAEWYLSQ